MQFATVYKAEDEKEDRVVAVKKIKLKLSSSLREGVWCSIVVTASHGHHTRCSIKCILAHITLE